MILVREVLDPGGIEDGVVCRRMTIGDICSQDRKTIPGGSAEARLRPYLGLELVESQTGSIVGEPLLNGEVGGSTTFAFDRRHVLYGKLRPYLNKVALPDFEGRCSTEFIPLLPHPGIPREFVALLLRRPETVRAVMAANTGSRMPRTDMKVLLGLEINVPGAAERERIVDILNRANGICRLRREALDKARQLIPAMFVAMFGDPATNPNGWPIRTFGELVAETQLGLVRSAKEMGEHHPVPYLRMDAIVGDGSLKLAGMRRVSASEAEFRRHSLRKGDFLFNTRNSRELVGKVGLVTADKPMIFNNNIMRVRFGDSVLPEYMAFFFCTTHVQGELENRKSGTTSVFAIYYKNLKTVPVIVPPLSLQREFASQLTDIQATITQQERMVEASEQLVASLMAQLFDGG